MTDVLAITTLFLGYALVSQGPRGAWLTAPMVFTAGGLLLGSAGLGVLTGAVTGETMRILTEATLVLVLFTDAVRIDLGSLRKEYALPLRLLGVGIPLGIVLGALFAFGLLPALGVAGALLLAAVLVPTDAALSVSVILNRDLPVRVRQSLNVESGLNGGVTLPVVVLLSAMVVDMGEAADAAPGWVALTAQQIGLGILVGVAVGGIGGKVLVRADTAGWVDATYRRLYSLALAALAYAAAEVVQGNGLLSVFVAGLVFGVVARSDRRFVYQFTEREGELLNMLTFTLFGALIIGPRLGDLDWRVLVYALLSLLVVRPLAVAVAALGTRLRPTTVLFLGWFGPRGLTSIVFALMVVEQADTAMTEQILTAVGATVLFSVYAHGAVAVPWARAYARRTETFAPSAPEHEGMTEHNHRWRPPDHPNR